MPIYEYQCKECGHRLEALQKISDAPLSVCPDCSQPALSKLVSAASFRLKGGGWYETDFKTGNKKQLADSDTGNKTEGKKDGDSAAKQAKSDSKSKAPSEKAGGKTAAAKPGSPAS